MDPNTPLWALSLGAAIAALVASGYGVIKLVRHAGDQWLEWAEKKRLAEKDTRSSAAEAWEVVDRLTKELEQVSPRIAALQAKCDQIKEEYERDNREANERAARCQADHEGTKKVLRIVVAWGEQKGLKLPPQIRQDVFDQAGPPGSDVHRALGGGTNDKA